MKYSTSEIVRAGLVWIGIAAGLAGLFAWGVVSLALVVSLIVRLV